MPRMRAKARRKMPVCLVSAQGGQIFESLVKLHGFCILHASAWRRRARAWIQLDARRGDLDDRFPRSPKKKQPPALAGETTPGTF
jgi:hypothetical protein